VDVVIRGSPADVMGMRSGDVLVRVGEYEVKGPDSQLEVLERLARGWPGRVAVSPSLAAAIEGSQGREVEVVWFSGDERKSAIVRLNAAGPFARAGPYQGPY
jgi:S1-C subfamily serine protease